MKTSNENTTGLNLRLLNLLVALLILGLLHDRFILLFELEDLLLLLGNCTTKLLNNLNHVGDLSLNLGDDL